MPIQHLSLSTLSCLSSVVSTAKLTYCEKFISAIFNIMLWNKFELGNMKFNFADCAEIREIGV